MSARVDNGPLRDAFRASGLSARDVCRRLGWVRPGTGTLDTCKLLRMLGVLHSHSGKTGKRVWLRTVSAEDARLIRGVLEPGWVGVCACGERVVSGDRCGWCERGIGVAA